MSEKKKPIFLCPSQIEHENWQERNKRIMWGNITK